MDFMDVLLDFVYIMIVQLQLNIYKKNIMLAYFILTQMLTMEMVFNGAFMMIRMYVHYPSMKLGDIYFPELEI